MWLSPINVTPQRVQALKRSCDEAYNVANAHVHLEKAAGTAQLAYCLAGRLVASKSGWILLEVPAALVRG
nr:hypothetical protein [Anaerolineae bacterium]NIN98410.1 hypothetical protein [Anaerolineae bacterium]NIQ80727.1 hypothetical protein [Anaerolineae bacterium]